MKSRDHSTSAPVRYIPKIFARVRLVKTSQQVKNLEKSKYFGPADVDESEVNGEEFECGKYSQCEASKIQNDLLFGDMGQGELLCLSICYSILDLMMLLFWRLLWFFIMQCMRTMFAVLIRISKWKNHEFKDFVLTTYFLLDNNFYYCE